MPRRSFSEPRTFNIGPSQSDSKIASNYWLKRAEHTRAKAITLSDQRLHDKLIKIANEYERLAFRATGSATLMTSYVPTGARL